ncbi:phage portal protein [Pelomonas sp. V22]|uniref:phage portal protein n=1 Tax=Pelomonas sp. V22 TaxID=2822139 RepID=UPI0024A91DBF|nr:phage portal protein [Pelomonas sp. V22]MDI4633302.1 phage portal protein [Pelomonas sp. V22]
MSQVLDLTARRHESRVLGRYLAERPGAAARAGVLAFGENNSTGNLTMDELAKMLGAMATASSGAVVTPDTALRVSAVYGCVSRIAGAISTLPLGLFERIDGGERQPVQHDYHWMLNERPCEEFSAADAWTYLVSAKLFYGDGYAQLLRPGYSSAKVIGWKPLHPNRVQPFKDSSTGEKYYRVQPEFGPAYVLDTADVVQLTSLGYDGLTSPSPITYAAREAIGNALAAQQFSGKLFSEGATFDYALQTDQNLKQEQLEGLKASLLARTSNSRAPLILSGGLKAASLSINPKDAEILGTRLFSVEEICRIFGVPPHLVGHTEKTSSWGTGMAEQGGNFVRYTLMTHLVQIAQEFNHRLWPIRQRFFVEHITAALEKGDTKSRFDAYRSALGRAGEQPFMHVDEIRRAENLPPREMSTNQVSTGAPNAA